VAYGCKGAHAALAGRRRVNATVCVCEGCVCVSSTVDQTPADQLAMGRAAAAGAQAFGPHAVQRTRPETKTVGAGGCVLGGGGGGGQ
jgi:hypothetical protein